jgi:hypothetical protein
MHKTVTQCNIMHFKHLLNIWALGEGHKRCKDHITRCRHNWNTLGNMRLAHLKEGKTEHRDNEQRKQWEMKE